MPTMGTQLPPDPRPAVLSENRDLLASRKGVKLMAKKDPWHSVKDEGKSDGRYHDETNCNTGNNIEKENIRSGMGGLPKCEECKRISG